MLIIVSKDISESALKKLEQFGEVVLFETEGITYDAIQNHPDIFVFPVNTHTAVCAPNTPENFLNILTLKELPMIKGENAVGSAYPETALYNAVSTPHYLIHNLLLTDKIIKQNCTDVSPLNVNQGYVRCNLVALPNNTFITSDKGILKMLKNEGLSVLFINPENIVLKGFPHGFFGGCCGMSNKHFFINGALKYFTEKADIELFVKDANLELIELSTEKPLDIGSILVFE